MAFSARDDLCLDGIEASLPSLEEQAMKRDKALSNLRQYVQACGGSLSEGWDCSMRFRITSRRHGRQGLTTDNYFYSPCGKTFRTHKQVAEFLGLQPLTKEQLQQQQQSANDTADDCEEHFSILSVTMLDAAVLTSSARSGKRCHSAMAATDSARGQHKQERSPAASAPAAVARAASSQLLSGSGSVPTAPLQQQPAKRTKAALAAKYAASNTGPGSSTMEASKAGTPAAAASMPSSASTATQAASCQTCTPSDAPSGCRQPDAGESQQAPQRTHMARPAASSNSAGSRSGSSSKAVSSKRAAAPAAQPAQQQQQQRVKQPVPKPWKPRAQPAWRLKLRELATAAVLAEAAANAARSSG